jgi:endonuclease YncB( thermonuclease family)
MKKFILLAALLPTLAFAQTTTAVPFDLPIVGIYDGDTINTTVSQLPYPLSKIRIRVRNIDTPEKGASAQCEREATLALEAQAVVQKLAAQTNPRMMTVSRCSHDKYGGRWVCDVNIAGTDVAKALIDANLAYYYTGGAKRSWCN